MYNEEITPTNAPVKKNWERPELHLISRNKDIASKRFPAVHEGTGSYVNHGFSKNFSNQAHTYGIVITSIGLPQGNKSSAVS